MYAQTPTDQVVTPEAFAQTVVDDYQLAPAYVATIAKQVADQLADFQAHQADEGDADDESGPVHGRLDLGADDAKFWDMWRARKRRRLSGGTPASAAPARRMRIRIRSPHRHLLMGMGTGTDSQPGRRTPPSGRRSTPRTPSTATRSQTLTTSTRHRRRTRTAHPHMARTRTRRAIMASSRGAPRTKRGGPSIRGSRRSGCACSSGSLGRTRRGVVAGATSPSTSSGASTRGAG